VFGPFLGVWLSQVAIKYPATGIASTILSTTPIFLIPVAAIIEREKATLRAIVGALVAVAGVAMLFLR
jgi:drug/metabolite transporter (DMT)-like permease